MGCGRGGHSATARRKRCRSEGQAKGPRFRGVHASLPASLVCSCAPAARCALRAACCLLSLLLLLPSPLLLLLLQLLMVMLMLGEVQGSRCGCPGEDDAAATACAPVCCCCCCCCCRNWSAAAARRLFFDSTLPIIIAFPGRPTHGVGAPQQRDPAPHPRQPRYEYYSCCCN